MGRSEVGDGEWRLLHERFGQPTELNEIRIRFKDDDTYHQEVSRLGQGGVANAVSKAILIRQRD